MCINQILTDLFNKRLILVILFDLVLNNQLTIRTERNRQVTLKDKMVTYVVLLVLFEILSKELQVL